MSQRMPASRPTSRSPPSNGRPVGNVTGQRLGDVRQEEQLVNSRPSRQSEPQQMASQHPAPLPPSRSSQAAVPPVEQRRTGRLRELGVHSILNPSEPERPSSSEDHLSNGEVRPSLARFESIPRSVTQPSTTAPHVIGRPEQTNNSTYPRSYNTTFSSSRPMLTPRSPRSFSLGGIRGQGTIDALRSPFLGASLPPFHGGQPGQPAQELPSRLTPTHGHNQQHYGFPPMGVPRGSVGNPHSNASRQSETMSPKISHFHSSQTLSNQYTSHCNPNLETNSSFSDMSLINSGGPQPSSRSGGQGEPTSTTEGLYSVSAPALQQAVLSGTSSPVSSASAGASSTRQTPATDPIQVLTITTSQGVYNVPVDVHQASRLADEKRARNAGASARFRQRRKEKEREANATIEKIQSQNRDLERRVRELEHERDFYRSDRDRLREVVYRLPETRHMALQVPPSPHSISREFPPDSGVAGDMRSPANYRDRSQSTNKRLLLNDRREDDEPGH